MTVCAASTSQAQECKVEHKFPTISYEHWLLMIDYWWLCLRIMIDDDDWWLWLMDKYRPQMKYTLTPSNGGVCFKRHAPAATQSSSFGRLLRSTCRASIDSASGDGGAVSTSGVAKIVGGVVGTATSGVATSGSAMIGGVGGGPLCHSGDLGATSGTAMSGVHGGVLVILLCHSGDLGVITTSRGVVGTAMSSPPRWKFLQTLYLARGAEGYPCPPYDPGPPGRSGVPTIPSLTTSSPYHWLLKITLQH